MVFFSAIQIVLKINVLPHCECVEWKQYWVRNVYRIQLGLSTSSLQDVPIVIAGNKVDVVREIEIEEVEDWVSSQLSKER